MTPEIANWMQKLLSHRLDIHLDVRFDAYQLVLSLPDHKTKIIFPCIIEEFYMVSTKKKEINCYNWYANSEGFRGLISNKLIAPAITALPQKLVQVDESGNVIFGYDILGLAYWCLCRIEEYASDQLDTHSRFKAEYSHAHKYNYLHRAIVDEWFDIFSQLLRLVWPQLRLKKNKYRVSISHDVDNYGLYYRQTFPFLLKLGLKSVLERGDFYDLRNGPRTWFKENNKLTLRDPYNTYRFLMDVSEKNNLKSTFYFIAGKSCEAYDANYDITDPGVISLLKEISYRGHYIGLHPSYECYCDINRFSQEFSNLKNVCNKNQITLQDWVRMHYLRFSYPETLRIQDSIGIVKDTTLGYPDQIGFRCGTCHDYPAFDPVTQSMLNIIIEPLLVMEAAVISPTLDKLGDSVKNQILDIKQTCEKLRGNFTMLWHNSCLSTKTHKAFYEAILEES